MTRPVAYIAAPLGEWVRASIVAAHAASAGYDVASRWHDDAAVRAGAADPLDDATRARIAAANDADLARAHIVIVLTAWGSPRSTYVEAGIALALGRPVLWVIGPGGEGRCSHDVVPPNRPDHPPHDAHPLVRRVVGSVRWDDVVRGELEAFAATWHASGGTLDGSPWLDGALSLEEART